LKFYLFDKLLDFSLILNLFSRVKNHIIPKDPQITPTKAPIRMKIVNKLRYGKITSGRNVLLFPRTFGLKDPEIQVSNKLKNKQRKPEIKKKSGPAGDLFCPPNNF